MVKYKSSNQIQIKYKIKYKSFKVFKFETQHRKYMIRVTCYISGGALFLLHCMDGGFCVGARLCLWEIFIGTGLILFTGSKSTKLALKFVFTLGWKKFILGFDPERWTQSTKDCYISGPGYQLCISVLQALVNSSLPPKPSQNSSSKLFSPLFYLVIFNLFQMDGDFDLGVLPVELQGYVQV